MLLCYLLADIYGYRGMRKLFSHGRLSPLKNFVLKTYWLADFLLVIFLAGWVIHIRTGQLEAYVQYRKFFFVFAAFLFVFVPKLSFALFVLLYDVKRILLKQSGRVFPSQSRSRSVMMRWRRSLLFPALGLIVAAMTFSLTLYGVGFGRYDFRVEPVTLWFEDLPGAFDGYRVVQFSDTHLGSYSQTDAVEAGLQLISYLEPDLILFTGDLVNNESLEAEKFLEAFRNLEAADGLFSVLGNHDMGDYRSWGTIQEKVADVDRLVALQQEMGFRVLRNEHACICRGQDSIILAGVDNWGLPPFGQYGDLSAALEGVPAHAFMILLSHDPSHWRAQVLPQTDVHLTLSGHTHGMQLGVSTRFFSWSPVQLLYNEWSGLYREGERKLYVNRGFGFLSFPGRIGMPPEITLLTLRRGSPPDKTPFL